MLMKGKCGNVEGSVCSFDLEFPHPVVSGLREGAASIEKLGMLGDRFALVLDSTSVPNVVRLSLVVELEGARPESLLVSSCTFDRAVGGERRFFEILGRPRLLNLVRGDAEGGVATVMGMGGLAAMVSL